MTEAGRYRCGKFAAVSFRVVMLLLLEGPRVFSDLNIASMKAASLGTLAGWGLHDEHYNLKEFGVGCVLQTRAFSPYPSSVVRPAEISYPETWYIINRMLAGGGRTSISTPTTSESVMD